VPEEKQKEVDPRQKAHEEERQKEHSNPPKPQKVRVINKYEREY
jgi:hypothetical protein